MTEHIRVVVDKFGYGDHIDMFISWVHPCNLVVFEGSSLFLSGNLTVSPAGEPATATLGGVVYETPESFSAEYNCGTYSVEVVDNSNYPADFVVVN